MKNRNTNEHQQLDAIRAALAAALVTINKDLGTNLKMGKATYDPSGPFTFKVDGIFQGGKSKEAIYYEQTAHFDGLPPLFTEFKHSKGTDKIVGLKGSKILTERNGNPADRFVWPVESIKQVLARNGIKAPELNATIGEAQR